MKAEDSITICNIGILSYETELIFVDNLQDFHRTHYCGDLRASDAGKTISVCGWVQRQRDKGALIFVDLRDRTGISS